MSSECAPSDHDLAKNLLDPCEQRVIRQFVEALLYEGLAPFRAQPTSTLRPPSVYDQEVEFIVGGSRFRCSAAFKAFDRVRVEQGSIVLLTNAGCRFFSIFEMLEKLHVEEAGKARLMEELGQTVEISRFNLASSSRGQGSRRTLGFQDLESAIVEGHQYHPSFKTRTGFSLDDHERYGSEGGATFQLDFLAIRRDLLRVALPGEEANFWRQELGEGQYRRLELLVEARGRDLEQYALVPAHPFQARRLRAMGFGEELESGLIVPLEPAGDFYHASQSLRTLVNATNPAKANVKLPLDVVCTSSRRNLEPHFVCTAPLLSSWLTSLVQADPFLRGGQRLELLSEYAAVSYESDQDDDKSGLLGVIFRQSAVAKLGPGEAAVPFTALTLVEADGRPFVEDWLKTHGVHTWVTRLVEVMLIPIWHMLVHHGVAFEAHAQNLILVHENGMPVRIVLRDFHEDTEFVPDFLSRPQDAPDFSALDPFFLSIPDDDGYRMADVESLRQLFMDTVYAFNLADVSFLLERFYGYSEEDFWGLVRVSLDEYERSGVTPQARIDRVDAGKEKIIVESLLKKTIHRGGTLDYFEHEVRNTLAASRVCVSGKAQGVAHSRTRGS